MYMKRMITSALAILLLAGAAQAQGRNKGDKQERRQDMKELNLSADQKTKLKDIHSREKAEMEALRNNTALTDEQRKTQRKQVHEKYVAERKALLTPEQQKKAAEFQDGWKDRRGQGGPGGRDTVRRHGGPTDGARGGQRGERMQEMAKDLNLSADQQQKMKAIHEQYRTKLEAIRNDNSLAQDQKKQKAQELMKAQRNELRNLLTPEQQQKFEQKHKGRKNATR
jgi:Spy/CpxP family protein refolding chaperone